MLIRDATADDWPAMWSFMQGIVAAGETFCWDRDTPEAQGRSYWCHQRPGRTFVAVDDDGTVVGTAESHPNHAGPGSHVANAGFMVNPAHGGRGIGRALCEHTVAAARADGFRAMQFNAVAESNVRAVSLWQSLGFEILATVPGAFEHPQLGFVGLHVMYRSLVDEALPRRTGRTGDAIWASLFILGVKAVRFGPGLTPRMKVDAEKRSGIAGERRRADGGARSDGR